MNKQNKKEPRPITLTVAWPAAWNLGRRTRFTLRPGAPTPEFLRHLIIKKGDT